MFSGDKERMLRTGYEIVVSPQFASDPANYAKFSEVARHHPADLQLLMSQYAAVNAHDVYARLRGLHVPTLVIHGTADRMLEVINGDLIASLIPDARLKVLEGTGHLFFLEQPELSAQLVREHAGAAREG